MFDIVRDQKLQRVAGYGRLDCIEFDQEPRVADLYQTGAAKIRTHRPTGRSSLEASLINTAGGLTGGDTLAWDITARSGTRLSLTTPAAEKIYKCNESQARAKTKIAVGANACLQWLPQETILFDKANFKRKHEVSLERSAAILMVESYIFGRLAMGERIEAARLEDRWQIFCCDHLVHREDFLIEADWGLSVGAPLTLNGMSACVTILYVGMDALDKLTAEDMRLFAGADDVIAAVDAWEIGPTSKLVARLVAPDGYHLKRAIIPLMKRLNNGQVPKSWSL